MKNLFGALVCVSFLGSLASCGSDGGGTCGNTAACGGEITGTWKITSTCLTADTTGMTGNMDCPGETVKSSNLQVTGNITFKSDLTYTSAFTSSGSVTVFLPSSCLTQGGTTFTCADLDALFNSGTSTDGSTAHCATSAGGCSCTLTEAAQTSNEMGTYSTTAAGVLTMMPSGGSSEDDDYCVKGTSLTVSPHNSGSSTMGTGESGTISLVKQ